MHVTSFKIDLYVTTISYISFFNFLNIHHIYIIICKVIFHILATMLKVKVINIVYK